MAFLKISNRGSWDRRFVEIIGLSTKRDLGNDDMIFGQYGSGAKFAAVAGLRLGLGISIASSDDAGPYFLTFEEGEIAIGNATARQVFLRYYFPEKVADGTWKQERKPAGWSAEAFANWHKPIGDDDKTAFKVLREFLCNAVDVDASGYRVEEIDKTAFAADGETSVFLPLTDEIRAMLGAEADRYFKFRSAARPIFDAPGVGSIYPKSEGDDGKPRQFVQGVLVSCSRAFWDSAVFDYSLHDKTLVSEERTVKNASAYLQGVAALFGQLADASIAQAILAAVAGGKGKYEERAMGVVGSFTPDAARAWMAAVRAHFGGAAHAVASGNYTIDQDTAQVFKHVLLGTDSWDQRHFFKKLGISAAESVAGIEQEFAYDMVDFHDLDVGSRRRFRAAFARFAENFPERSRIPVTFYYPRNEQCRKVAALAGLGSVKLKEIWIATQTPTSLIDKEGELFKSLMHEGRHVRTNANDYDRAFVNRADDDGETIAYGLARHSLIEPAKSPNLVDLASRDAKGMPLVDPDADAVALGRSEIIDDEEKT